MVVLKLEERKRMIKVFGNEVMVTTDNAANVAAWIRYGCPVKSKAHPGRLLWLAASRMSDGHLIGDAEPDGRVALAPTPFQSAWSRVAVGHDSGCSPSSTEAVYDTPENIEPDFSNAAARYFVKEGLS